MNANLLLFHDHCLNYSIYWFEINKNIWLWNYFISDTTTTYFQCYLSQNLRLHSEKKTVTSCWAIEFLDHDIIVARRLATTFIKRLQNTTGEAVKDYLKSETLRPLHTLASYLLGQRWRGRLGLILVIYPYILHSHSRLVRACLLT